MDDPLVHGLQNVYYAEHQILTALPKMIDKATNRDLSKRLRAPARDRKSGQAARSSLQ
jgi:ferritin-like metal-binding protein YciE